MKHTLIFIEVVIVLCVLCVLSYFSFQWAMEGIVHSRREEVVPEIKNKSVSVALDMLAPLNLALVKEGKEFDESVPIGTILRQSPPPGTTVREGKIIKIVLSQGGETVFVPSLMGLPLRNAEMLLYKRGLLLGEVSKSYSLRMERGVVVSQDPRPETSAEKNCLVSIVVSGGKPPEGIVLMPDFRQKNLAQVLAWSNTRGFSVSISTDPTSLFPHGAVLIQEPSPDAVVRDSAGIRVLISGRLESLDEETTVKNIHYEVSQGPSKSSVRIVLVDPVGEREIFNGRRSPGSKIDLTVPAPGDSSKVRIFVNGILVEERDL